MDLKNNKKTRIIAQIPRCKNERKNPRSQIKRNRTLKKSKDEETCSIGKDAKKNAQEKTSDTKWLDPIKEQLHTMLEYIRILEIRKDLARENQIIALSEFLDLFKRHCDFYLNYEFLRTGRLNG